MLPPLGLQIVLCTSSTKSVEPHKNATPTCDGRPSGENAAKCDAHNACLPAGTFGSRDDVWSPPVSVFLRGPPATRLNPMSKYDHISLRKALMKNPHELGFTILSLDLHRATASQLNERCVSSHDQRCPILKFQTLPQQETRTCRSAL